MPSRTVLVSSVPSLVNDRKDGRGGQFAKYKIYVTSQKFSSHGVIFQPVTTGLSFLLFTDPGSSASKKG